MDEETSKEACDAEDAWAPSGTDERRGQRTVHPPGMEAGEQYVVEPNPSFWRGPDFFQNSSSLVKLIPNPQDREAAA